MRRTWLAPAPLGERERERTLSCRQLAQRMVVYMIPDTEYLARLSPHDDTLQVDAFVRNASVVVGAVGRAAVGRAAGFGKQPPRRVGRGQD